MDYPISLKVEFPAKLSRLTTFFRPLMAIPHLVVLYFLGLAAGVVLVISWFAILFTARYPKALFDYMTWYWRWSTRVNGYMYLLTDKYPPFTGDE